LNQETGKTTNPNALPQGERDRLSKADLQAYAKDLVDCLNRWNISKRDAATIIEWMKPELRRHPWEKVDLKGVPLKATVEKVPM